MSNKIPIDDLFREALSGGKEQLNLGAWANMERMLNGQNPYAGDEKESKRKRRILPFLAIFLLLSTAMTAGYLWLNKKDNIAQDLSQATVKATESPAKSTNSIQTDLNTNPTPSNPENNTDIAIEPVQKKQNRRNHSNKTAVANDIAEKTDKNQESAITPGDETMLTEKKVSKTRTNKRKKNQAENTPIGTELNKNEGIATNIANEDAAKKSKMMEQIVANEKVTKNRDGSIKNVSYDTIDKSFVTIENKIPQSTILLANNEIDANYKYHPRYLGAQVDADETPIVLNNALMQVPVVEAKGPSLASRDEKPKSEKNNDKISVFGAIGAFATLTMSKIGDASGDFFRLFKAFDPGVSMGVNAALFRTQHNYGGFHAGLTNHTAISETFSLISELKFFIRNNAGFTINDIKTQLLNKSADTSVPGQTTYSYQVDSLTKKYNFKSFMSLELPLMLSARFNKISIYGGPNFVYNFKLKINEIDKKYVVNKEEVVSNLTQYNYPAELGMKYTRNDFGARFGIGYAMGLSFNFHPKIAIDLRVSKVVWDNTKTNSQREISNGVTKVPFTQLSLAYKFLDK